MDTQPAEFRIEVDGRMIVARPRPEDQATLEELLGSGQTAHIRLSEADTEGHVLAADELGIDVEGHAMTLRLPNAADAAALRRALAVTALTATVAVGSFAAGTYVQGQTHASTLSAPAITTEWVAPFDAPEAAPAPAQWVAPFDAPEAAPAQVRVAPFDAPEPVPDWVAPFDAPEAVAPVAGLASKPTISAVDVNADEGIADQASQITAGEFAQSGTAGQASQAASDQSDQDINVGNRGHEGTAPAQPEPLQPSRQGGSHPE